MKATDKQVGGDHYKTLPVQPGHYIRKNKLGWYEGNIVKYITRHQQKGGRQDVEKVIHYAELLLEEYDGEKANDQRSNPTDGGNADGTGATAKFTTTRSNLSKSSG